MVLVAVLVLCGAVAYGGDYQTPGTGGSYTLASLVAGSGGTVTGGPTAFSLNGNLTIAQNDTIVVSAGEQVSAASDAGGLGFVIRIDGTLTAQGTSGQPIVFTAASSEPGAWRGIYMMPTCVGSAVEHCEINYALTGIHCAGCNPAISNNSFSGCRDAGIYCCRGASPTITWNTLSGNSQAVGIVVNECVPTSCAHNTADDNAAGISVANSTGAPVIAENSANENREIGIYSASATGATFQDNVVERNAYGIVAARGSNGQFLRNQVRQNIFEGVSVVEEASPVFRNTVVEDNSTTLGGVVVYDTAEPDFGSPLAAGVNQFLHNHYYDYVNFTEKRKYAVGNTWSSPMNDADFCIYDDEEDAGDADGSGFLSGMVMYEPLLSAHAWWLYH
jgi:parallel beta-helix repeat protein